MDAPPLEYYALPTPVHYVGEQLEPIYIRVAAPLSTDYSGLQFLLEAQIQDKGYFAPGKWLPTSVSLSASIAIGNRRNQKLLHWLRYSLFPILLDELADSVSQSFYRNHNFNGWGRDHKHPRVFRPGGPWSRGPPIQATALATNHMQYPKKTLTALVEKLPPFFGDTVTIQCHDDRKPGPRTATYQRIETSFDESIKRLHDPRSERMLRLYYGLEDGVRHTRYEIAATLHRKPTLMKSHLISCHAQLGEFRPRLKAIRINRCTPLLPLWPVEF